MNKHGTGEVDLLYCVVACGLGCYEIGQPQEALIFASCRWSWTTHLNSSNATKVQLTCTCKYITCASYCFNQQHKPIETTDTFLQQTLNYLSKSSRERKKILFFCRHSSAYKVSMLWTFYSLQVTTGSLRGKVSTSKAWCSTANFYLPRLNK